MRIGVGFLAVVCALTPASHAQTAVTLAAGKMPAMAHVDDRFQSYNIEMIEVTGGRFWAPYKAAAAEQPAEKQQAGPAGMPASLYRYRPPTDLESPKLEKFAAALGPAYVRVSGTWANSTYFWDSDVPAPEKPPAGFNGVLTRKEWKGVVDFAHAADARIVTSFAISPGVRDSSGVWTPVEAEKLLAYTKSIGGSIAAAEMFNEPTVATMGGAPKGYNAESYGRDFKAFWAYIEKADPKMLILGPGGVGEGGGLLGHMPGMIRSEDILRDEGPGLDAFSYHYYGSVSQRCARMGPAGMGMTPEKALSEQWLTLTLRDEAFYAALRDKYAPGKPMWLTETAETACGGDPWAADYIDSFRYLAQLGELAQKNVQVVMHNTLNASDYGLLDETTLEPRPDYWAAVLWRRLMGTTVLDPGAAGQPNLYVFAQCLRGKRGGVALLAINADREQARQIELAKDSKRYTLTAPDLLGTEVDLNGVELKAASDGSLPKMEGVPQTAGTVKLKPLSISFFAVPGAKNAACR